MRANTCARPGHSIQQPLTANADSSHPTETVTVLPYPRSSVPLETGRRISHRRRQRMIPCLVGV
jgi:hypothetical protein